MCRSGKRADCVVGVAEGEIEVDALGRPEACPVIGSNTEALSIINAYDDQTRPVWSRADRMWSLWKDQHGRAAENA